MINNHGHGEALAYNVLAGALPECLQLDTISAIFSEKLRHLPTYSKMLPHFRIKSGFFMANNECGNSIKACQTAIKIKPKIVWHLNKKRRYFTVTRSLAKRAYFFIF